MILNWFVLFDVTNPSHKIDESGWDYTIPYPCAFLVEGFISINCSITVKNRIVSSKGGKS